MKFEFTRYGLTLEESRLERALEILPALTSWSLIFGFVLLAFLEPLYAAVFIIVFDFYWLLRLFYMILFLLLSYFRLSMEKETDWMSRIQSVDRWVQGRLEPEPSTVPGFKSRFSEWIFSRELKKLKKKGSMPPPSQDIYNLVIVPIAKESPEIVEQGVASFAHGQFPSGRMVVVLAVEERAEASLREGILELEKKYRRHFLDFFVVFHPDGLPGEARVKGANAAYAAQEASKFFETKQIPFEHVIVSCFDADTVVGPDYFACVTYTFMICPGRWRASFQPIPVYHNNIWEAPNFARVLDLGSSFFQMAEATNPEKLVTFSSHSMSLKALRDVGYWPVDMISDDSAIFWKAFIHFEGDYRVVPMYVTLSMDVVNAGSWWKTLVNVYKQKQRWAWGIENFPIVMRGFLHSQKISWYNKLRYGFKLFETHVSWATWSILLGVCGWLPAFFASREFSDSIVYYSAPRITALIFHLASWSLLVTIVLSLCLLPERKVKFPLLKRVLHAFEWLLVPVIAIFFSALPALDAQTRLMLGKYMEFWVTEKRR